MKVLLDVGEFDVDGDYEMTVIQRHINILKHNLGGGMSGEFVGITAIEAFKELD